MLPVINKIDLPSADPQRAKHEIEDVIGIPAQDAPEVSAKMGTNIEEVLERIVTDIPAPDGDPHAPLQALIFDSQYDSYRGRHRLYSRHAGHDSSGHEGEDDGNRRRISGCRDRLYAPADTGGNR